MTSLVAGASKSDIVQRIIAFASTVQPMRLVGTRIYNIPNAQLLSLEERGVSSEQRALISEFQQFIANDKTAANKAADSRHTIRNALLLLGLDAMDECHNIVTAPSESHNKRTALYPIACYAHALTHRREGELIGDFGSGWTNYRYWLSQAGQQSNFPVIAEYAAAIVTDQSSADFDALYAKNSDIQSFVSSLTTNSKTNKNNNQNNQNNNYEWQSDLFVQLCEESVACLQMKKQTTEKAQQNEVAMSYCQRVSIKEWQLLVKSLS